MTHFNPDNLEEVMEDFLSGRRRNPDNATYSKLDSLDYDARASSYNALLDEVKRHPDIQPKHHQAYEEYIKRSQQVLELMHQAVLFRNSESEETRELARTRFQEINESIYGAPPEPRIACAMVHEVLDDTKAIDEPEIKKIRAEFIDLLPSELTEPDGAISTKLEPSEESKQTISRVVELIYRPLLTHTDKLLKIQADEEGISEDQLKVSPQGIAVIFQEIINHEFPDSGWKALLNDANAIQVDVVAKEIRVPKDRLSATANKTRGLVVHEIGVHMLRSVIGEKSNLIPLRYGLSGGNEAEEGIAKVMESALTDDAARTGYQHYLTAILLGSGMEFRDAHEIMWRYKALDSYLNKPKAKIDDDFINRRKKEAFKFMFRSIRGTNQLPWHLTLSYFNGTHKMWDFVEKYREDPDFIAIMFMGRIDPTNQDHLKSAFNAMSRV